MSDNQNSARSVITEEAWYGFQSCQQADDQQQQHARNCTDYRIMIENCIFDNDDKNTNYIGK
jgi:hypothetical protein